MIIPVIAALEPLTLEVNVKLAVAIIYGIILGFILVKCNFANREEVQKNLTFASTDMAKIILTMLGVGLIAFATLREQHVLQAHCPEAAFWGVLFGGICTGVGLGIGGLVPLTAVAALASGKLYAVWTLLGMAAAIPAAKILKEKFSGVVDKLDAPVSASLEPGNGLWSVDSPVLWLGGITLLIVLVMHFCGAGTESKK